MKPIGGFLGLEIGRATAPYHDGTLALCSGRACLACILDRTGPSAAHVPSYICDSALIPIRERRIPVRFYAIADTLQPDGIPDVAPGELLLFVNYFGLRSGAARTLAGWLGPRLVVDDTHAFFERGYGGAWSFNSARKFFGVGDGGYAYGPGLRDSADRPRIDTVRYEHLVTRWLGDPDSAYRQYLENEAAISAEPLRISMLSERILGTVDYDAVRDARRRNFRRVHERLGARNRVPPDVLALGDQVPYCYPLLPDGPQPSRDTLWNNGLFVPVLWPEVAGRDGLAFARERAVAECLLPLPIDQRYDEHDMDDLCDRLCAICSW